MKKTETQFDAWGLVSSQHKNVYTENKREP